MQHINSVFKNLLCATAIVASSSEIFAQASYQEKVTSASNIAMTVSNLGLIGNSFSGSFNVLGNPSCEFPKNSGIEHLFEGGLWLGALVNGSQIAVSTGALDDATGYTTGKGGFEYSAAIGATLAERSSLIDNPLYNTSAISHQDFVSDFTDKNTVVPGTTIQIRDHLVPLGADVHFESYNYNFNFANFFVILDYTITNNSLNRWDSLFIGYWTDGVIRNVNKTVPGGTAFFNKGGNGYIDSLYLGYEFDGAGDLGFTESYFGLKFLGAEDKAGFAHPDVRANFNDNFNSWQFNNTADPLYFFPGNDQQRFDKLSSGLNNLPNWETQIRPTLRQPNNRSQLLSAGPFVTVNPGESVNISFAIICAKKREDGLPNTSDNAFQQSFFVQNANFTQTAYNGEDVNFNGILDPGEDRDEDGKLTRFVLPSPPNTPQVKVIPSSNKIEVYWSKNAEASVDPISKKKDFEGYRIYKSALGFDIKQTQDVLASLKLVAEYDVPGNKLFNETGLSPIILSQPLTFAGDTNRDGSLIEYAYKYTFNNVQNGWQHAVAITAFDTGDDVNNLESLESGNQLTLKRVFPGKVENKNFANGDPFVYPDPYYSGAEWEGASASEENKKLNFSNLPAKCVITIYTLSGDIVKVIEHDQNYNGSDSRWYSTNANTDETVFSGGEHSWDLLSKDNQLLARGLYLFAVKDKQTGKLFQGKFSIIK